MAATTWKLADEVAAECQGFVVSGYGTLRHGRAFFLTLPKNAGGDWLRVLQESFPVTAAAEVGGGARIDRAISLAFTHAGLRRMGLAEDALASFSAPFREGMFETDRMRRLGDKRGEVWQDTVLQGGPRWSGTPLPHPPAVPGGAVARLNVHALLLVYTAHAGDLADARAEIAARLSTHGVEIAYSLNLQLDDTTDRPGREHFGFADGVSQPLPYDKHGALRGDTPPDPLNGAPLGEFVMGFENGHQEIAPGPLVPGETEGKPDPRPKAAGLSEHPDALGQFDIGRHGSYLVVRELNQDVAAFWKSMENAAQVIRSADPDASHITADWLAEKIVGRNADGHVLRETGPLAPRADGQPDNDFRFFDDDHDGRGCPLGSHIRRANPRDSLAPKPEMKETLLDAANNHRILRRGRNYGSRLDNRMQDDGQDRGLLFMCLNTDIARQFEFIQQTWMLNSDFSTLFEEVDPLIGADGWTTIPEEPLRRRIKVMTFVQLTGGEYFFLPGMSALRYLSML